MMNLLSKIFTRVNRTEELKKEVEELKTKLADRQEVINKTNAYWKKKLRDAIRKS